MQQGIAAPQQEGDSVRLHLCAVAKDSQVQS